MVTPGENAAASPGTADVPVGGTGCGGRLTAEVSPGTTAVRRIESGGLTREYRIHVPVGSGPAARMPVVFNFHGRYANAPTQESYSGLTPTSDREGFLLVSPEGAGSPQAWSAGATPPSTVDDVRFVGDLLDTLERDFCVDPSRVYAAGMSNGGFMASKLGCTMGDRFAAIATVGGIHFPSEQCGTPVPVLAIHGSADQVVPFAGGKIRDTYPYPGARKSVAQWAAFNGCTVAVTTERIAPHAVRETSTGCRAATVLIVGEGDGHTWPGASDALAMGKTSREFSAAEMIWQFFAGQRRVSLAEGSVSIGP